MTTKRIVEREQATVRDRISAKADHLPNEHHIPPDLLWSVNRNHFGRHDAQRQARRRHNNKIEKQNKANYEQSIEQFFRENGGCFQLFRNDSHTAQTEQFNVTVEHDRSQLVTAPDREVPVTLIGAGTDDLTATKLIVRAVTVATHVDIEKLDDQTVLLQFRSIDSYVETSEQKSRELAPKYRLVSSKALCDTQA